MKDVTISEKARADADKAIGLAQTALVAADNQALFNQVKEAEEGRVTLARALDGVMSVYAGDSTKRLAPPSDNAIDAMRDVALACVELAKAVVAAK